LISVAHEAGNLNELRAVLGNDAAITASREEQRHHHRLALRLVAGKRKSL
jgi:hypothetical protein